MARKWVHNRHTHVDKAKDEVIARYRAGESTYELGRAYNVNGTTIWNRLIEWGIERRASGGQRNPGGPLFGCGNNGTYLGTKDREQRHVLIHRGCWEAYYGSIPSGFEIHHIDGNLFNNGIENLACITHADHMKLHRAERRKMRA